MQLELQHFLLQRPDLRFIDLLLHDLHGVNRGKRIDVIDLVARTKVGTADVGQQASGIAFWKMSQ